MTKPDPRMFRRFLEQYALQPEACVFVDDTLENVEAAKAMGFEGVHFASFEQLTEALRQLGILDRA